MSVGFGWKSQLRESHAVPIRGGERVFVLLAPGNPNHLFEVCLDFQSSRKQRNMIAFKAGSLCYEGAVADAAAI